MPDLYVRGRWSVCGMSERGMEAQDLKRRLAGLISSFFCVFAFDRRGNVAIMFALVMPVLIMLTMGGVDINRASSFKMNLQDALDSATLAAARSHFTSDDDITRVGLAALESNLAQNGGGELVSEATSFHLNDEGVVVASARVNVNALVGHIFLPPYGQFLDAFIPVSAHSEVMRSNNRVEVALVLDNTGSMAGSKMTNTKAAAIDLINRLEAADARSIEEDAVRISLVPFSMTVRVPTDGSQPPWMTNDGSHTGGTGATGLFSTPVGRFTLFQNLNTSWAGCVEARAQPYDIRDTAPTVANLATMFVPQFAPDTPDDAYSNSTWRNWYNEDRNDYVPDGSGFPSSITGSTRDTVWFSRAKNVSKYSNTPRGSLHSNFGPNRYCSIQPMIRLTNDFNALRNGVNAMVPSGNTQVQLGAMWGWHTLSPSAPFADGRPYGEERLTKIMILMTDGENVMNDTNNPHRSNYNAQGYIWQGRLGVTNASSSTRRQIMDHRLDSPVAGQEDLCGNMKAQGVVIYTVAVQVDSQAQAVMQRCATSANHYFNVNSAAAIGATFDRIAGAIENLRITR